MTLEIELTPQEEAWLADQSAQQGVPPKQIIKQMFDERLAAGSAAPHSGVYKHMGPSGERIMGQSQPRGSRRNPQAATTAPLTAEQATAIALFNSYLENEATDDPEEIRQAELELEEFKRNMNANRAATGDRLVFP